VAFVSGFDIKTKKDMTENPKKYLGQVIDIFTQEMTENERLRHATFHRLRHDMNKELCTMNKLKNDLKKAAVAKRVKTM
jgi:ATP-dependent DNA ligase